MSNNIMREKLVLALPLVAVILTAVVMRLMPHPPNMAPIAGLALFTGAYMNKRFSFLIPLSAMLISDFFLGFHSTMPFVYGSFLLIGLMGLLLKKNVTAIKLLGTSIVASVLFFVVTNFGVWATGTMYTKSLAGLMECYVMGIPFFGNTVAGDLIFTFGFFYGYKYMKALTSYPATAVGGVLPQAEINQLVS